MSWSWEMSDFSLLLTRGVVPSLIKDIHLIFTDVIKNLGLDALLG